MQKKIVYRDNKSCFVDHKQAHSLSCLAQHKIYTSVQEFNNLCIAKYRL